MPDSTGPERPMVVYPRWAGGLSLVMFVVGCLLAGLSGVVKDINEDKLGFITGAAVFIPLGALGLGMAYTSRVHEALTRRIDVLEEQLRTKSNS